MKNVLVGLEKNTSVAVVQIRKQGCIEQGYWGGELKVSGHNSFN